MSPGRHASIPIPRARSLRRQILAESAWRGTCLASRALAVANLASGAALAARRSDRQALWSRCRLELEALQADALHAQRSGMPGDWLAFRRQAAALGAELEFVLVAAEQA